MNSYQFAKLEFAKLEVQHTINRKTNQQTVNFVFRVPLRQGWLSPFSKNMNDWIDGWMNERMNQSDSQLSFSGIERLKQSFSSSRMRNYDRRLNPQHNVTSVIVENAFMFIYPSIHIVCAGEPFVASRPVCRRTSLCLRDDAIVALQCCFWKI